MGEEKRAQMWLQEIARGGSNILVARPAVPKSSISRIRISIVMFTIRYDH